MTAITTLRRGAGRVFTPPVLRRHGFVFAAGMAVMLVANIAVGQGWWTFWPMFTWTLAYAIHSFIVRSMFVDTEWVEERVLDARRGSYDVSHILDIEGRRDTSDPSVTHPAER